MRGKRLFLFFQNYDNGLILTRERNINKIYVYIMKLKVQRTFLLESGVQFYFQNTMRLLKTAYWQACQYVSWIDKKEPLYL